MSAVPPPIITIPQDCETPARCELVPGSLALTYVYARSRDTQQAKALGQDFIAYRYDAAKLAFAVCDGVSQSFYGDIAACFLGTRLVEWLWDWNLTPISAPLHGAGSFADSIPPLYEVERGLGGEVDFPTVLNSALTSWTADATALVQAKVIRPDLPEMHKVALERKRANGSESMFVAGLIDLRTGQAALCWMGDMRLWLWDAVGEPIELPGAVWKTRERWSSQGGPRNSAPHGCILPLDKIAHMTAHSDGVGHFANSFAKLAQDQLDPMVAELLDAPANDDISVLDIAFAVQPTYGDWQPLATPRLQIADPAEAVLTWEAVPFASRYRVSVDDGELPYTREVRSDIHTPTYTFFLPTTPAKSLMCAVQALNDYTLPSEWSAPVTFNAEEKAAPVIPIEAPASKTQPKRPKGKRPRRRVTSCLIMAVSAFILTAIIVAAWIIAAVLLWNNAILDAMQRM